MLSNFVSVVVSLANNEISEVTNGSGAGPLVPTSRLVGSIMLVVSVSRATHLRLRLILHST